MIPTGHSTRLRTPGVVSGTSQVAPACVDIDDDLLAAPDRTRIGCAAVPLRESGPGIPLDSGCNMTTTKQLWEPAGGTMHASPFSRRQTQYVSVDEMTTWRCRVHLKRRRCSNPGLAFAFCTGLAAVPFYSQNINRHRPLRLLSTVNSLASPASSPPCVSNTACCAIQTFGSRKLRAARHDWPTCRNPAGAVEAVVGCVGD
jgi:hypothetical protein